MKSKKVWIAFVLIILILLIFSACLYQELKNYYLNPANTEGSETIFNVNPGQSLNEIADNLYRKKIIESPFKFKLLARIKSYDKKIKKGEYLLSSALSPRKIMEKMVHGHVQLYRLTIPEGYNIKQIAEIVEAVGFDSKEVFLKATQKKSLLLENNIKADTVEGYLFPETYYFPKNTNPDKIIDTMIKQFWKIFDSKKKNRTKQMGLSIHKVVTMASIIEKETSVPFERPVIASVFYNRLRKNMRLESDPTVIYGLKDFDGNITRKHLTAATAYNTYVIRGMPPGPIANPGRQSLNAALYPEQTNYLYFVSKRDKTHAFSTNFADHKKAVQKYQLRK